MSRNNHGPQRGLDYQKPEWAAVALQDLLAHGTARGKPAAQNAQLARWKRESQASNRAARRAGVAQPANAKSSAKSPSKRPSEEEIYAELERQANASVEISRSAAPTLAHKLGLVEQPSSELSLENWQARKETYRQRVGTGAADDECPICQEHLADAVQILTSCCHSFHQHCLKSLEQFATLRNDNGGPTRPPACPLCRETRYAKRIVFEAVRARRVRAATRIQTVWRGSRARAAYHRHCLGHVAQHPRFARRMLARQLAQLSSTLETQVGAARDAHSRHMQAATPHISQGTLLVDAVLAILRSRNLNSQMLVASGADTCWEAVAARAAALDQSECPICLKSLLRGKGGSSCGGSRTGVSLLSCAHMFHTACIRALEAHTADASVLSIFSRPDAAVAAVEGNAADCGPSCPICRAVYQRTDS